MTAPKTTDPQHALAAVELVKLITADPKIGAKKEERGLSGAKDFREYYLALFRECLAAVCGGK